ncbi:MAG: hypothetical protein JXA87_02490 [Thermoleophilia bacterium]|nr:hypothetical protein [Thermoleophilia bacterium]
MRRGSILLVIAMMLMVVLATVGCGNASNVLPALGEDSPEAILAAAMTSAQEMTSAAGSFTVTMDYDFDTSGMPEEALAYLQEPMTVAGTFASGTDPQTADLDLTLTMGGEAMSVGIKLNGDKGWMRMLDQWYEAPPEMMSGSTFDEAQIAEMIRLMNELGVDPVTWFKDLTLAGEEKVEGVTAYHLSGTPDLAKILADVMGLMESEEFMALVDPDGMMTASLGEGMFAISADELQEVQDQISSMFNDLKVDAWIAKDDNTLRKADVVTHITPPEDEDTGGLNAVDINLGLLLTGANQPVTVEPPASALPYEALEKAMMENPEMFMGPFMGLYSLGLGDPGLDY